MATEMKSNTHTTTTTKLQLLPLLLLLLQKQFTFQRTDLLNTINDVRITGDDFDGLLDPHSSGCLQHCDFHLGLWLNGDHARILWASMSESLNQMVYKIPPWFVKQQEPIISLFVAWKRPFLKQLGSQLTSSDMSSQCGPFGPLSPSYFQWIVLNLVSQVEASKPSLGIFWTLHCNDMCSV